MSICFICKNILAAKVYIPQIIQNGEKIMTKRIRLSLRPILFLLTSFLLVVFGMTKASAYTNAVTTLKVGICFESNGSDVEDVILLNEIGEGFNFGYFDSSRKFVKVSDAGWNSKSLYIFIFASGNTVVMDSSSNAVLYQQNTAEKGPIGIMPIQKGLKCETWCKGFRYYGGFEITALSGGTLQVVNVVDIEDYVKGVIPAEMSPSWPSEALKAQAMCARTYAAMNINSHSGFDVCNGPCCQVYYGRNTTTAVTDSAVDATAGKYVLYNGYPCETFFYSSNGGATEACENVWTEKLPYLVAKFDDYDTSIDTGYNSWTYTYSAAEITDILNSSGYTIGTVTSVTPTYTAVGNIYSLAFSDGKNTVTVSKQEAGDILYSSKYGKYTHSQRFSISGSSSTVTGLYINNKSNSLDSISSAYAIGGDGSTSKVAVIGGSVSVMTGSGIKTINPYGSGSNQTGTTFTVKGSGWGHNVGMSQYGAKAMALAGKNYEDIIKYYFTGVTIG